VRPLGPEAATVQLTPQDIEHANAVSEETWSWQVPTPPGLTQADRVEAAQRIDPATARVWYRHEPIYHLSLPQPEHPDQYWVGRVYYAADPRERVPVRLDELPSDTRAALEDRRREVSFRAWKLVLRVPKDWEATATPEEQSRLQVQLDELDRRGVFGLLSPERTAPLRVLIGEP
jgi:hypothetical protein